MGKQKNLCGKSRKVDAPYAVFRSEDGWEWKVLKTYQAPEEESLNPYARWFCSVSSPFTHGGYDMGDVYVRDVGPELVAAEAIFLEGR
jgi:hypothetical protein